MSDDRQPLLEQLKESAELHLPETLTGFFEKLETDDDWSVIIKLHAMLESMFSLILTEACCEHEELSEVFSQLEMSSRRCGKVAFMLALGLIKQPHFDYVCELSKLRNQLVHNVANVTFSLKAHIDTLKPKQREGLIKTLIIKDRPFPQATVPYYLDKPLVAVIAGALLVVLHISSTRLDVLVKRDPEFWLTPRPKPPDDHSFFKDYPKERNPKKE